jgi:hypothetical protein
MGKIRLDWKEAQGGDLPMVCPTCGDDATEWVERRLTTVRPGLFCIVRTSVTVRLPTCRRHRVWSWNGFMRVVARSITDNGVMLGQVSEDFVDAVWDYRDNPDRYRRRAVRRAGRRRDEDDDWEDEEPRRRRRSSDSSRVLYGVMMTLLVIAGVSCAGIGLFLLSFGVPGGRPSPGFGPQRPGFNQPGGFRPGGPNFPKGPFR